jgi:hypothetical protein
VPYQGLTFESLMKSSTVEPERGFELGFQAVKSILAWEEKAARVKSSARQDFPTQLPNRLLKMSATAPMRLC